MRGKSTKKNKRFTIPTYSDFVCVSPEKKSPQNDVEQWLILEDKKILLIFVPQVAKKIHW